MALALNLKHLPVSLWLLIILSLSAAVHAEPQTATAHADALALQSLLGKLDNLSGTFTQTLKDRDGELLQESRGSFSMQRPGKFRWHTLTPFEQLLVCDQKTLWLYDPDLEQVTIRAFDGQLQQTPALLLSGGLGELVQNYHITRLDKGSDRPSFQLIPRAEEPLFVALELSFNGGLLSGMRIMDSLGQETNFALGGLEANTRLDDSQFSFEAPPGTDVLIDEQS